VNRLNDGVGSGETGFGDDTTRKGENGHLRLFVGRYFGE
jgi:hypothetical protein